MIDVSTCCKATPVEDFRDNPRDHHDPIEIYTCSECKKECDIEEVCEFCLGTGEIIEDGRDSSGNIERGVNSRRCVCRVRDDME